MKEKIKDIVYQAIREIAGTEDPFHFAVHDDMCYDIAVRAVELAMEEKTKPITASWKEVAKLSFALGQHHYRGIQIDTKEWVYGFLVIAPQLPFFGPPSLCETSMPCGNFYYIIQWEDNVEQYFRVYPESVGRCTGLTDKNGNVIWEGDIIQTKLSKSIVKFGEYKHLHAQVGYRNGDIGFYAYHINKVRRDIIRNDLLYFNELCEVVGNIHDNPELLKGGEE